MKLEATTAATQPTAMPATAPVATKLHGFSSMPPRTYPAVSAADSRHSSTRGSSASMLAAIRSRSAVLASTPSSFSASSSARKRIRNSSTLAPARPEPFSAVFMILERLMAKAVPRIFGAPEPLHQHNDHPAHRARDADGRDPAFEPAYAGEGDPAPGGALSRHPGSAVPARDGRTPRACDRSRQH